MKEYETAVRLSPCTLGPAPDVHKVTVGQFLDLIPELFTINSKLIDAGEERSGVRYVVVNAVYKETGEPGGEDEKTLIIYDPNIAGQGADAGQAQITESQLKVNKSITVRGATFTKARYKQTSWNTSPDGSGLTVNFKDSLNAATIIGADNVNRAGNSNANILYAQYEPVELVVEIKGSSIECPYNNEWITNKEYTINSATYYDANDNKVTVFDFTIENVNYKGSGIKEKDVKLDANNKVIAYEIALSANDFEPKNSAYQNVRFVIDPNNSKLKLTINKRKVTLTSATAEKEYNGSPLTKNAQTDIAVTEDGFADGEGATYDITGSQTIVGSSENSFTYTLNTGTKADNYEITKVYGTLTVKNRGAKYKITVKANSNVIKYDGSPKTVEGLETTSFSIDDNTYTVSGLSASASGTDAGTYPSNVIGTPVVKDANNNDVTSQFAVGTENGQLSIEKRKVTLESASAEQKYNGKPLTKNAQTDITVTDDGFADGEGATYNITGSQTIVGKSKNTFTYSLNEGTKADNYTIVPKE